jgi:hypothetical protein
MNGIMGARQCFAVALSLAARAANESRGPRDDRGHDDHDDHHGWPGSAFFDAHDAERSPSPFMPSASKNGWMMERTTLCLCWWEAGLTARSLTGGELQDRARRAKGTNRTDTAKSHCGTGMTRPLCHHVRIAQSLNNGLMGSWAHGLLTVLGPESLGAHFASWRLPSCEDAVVCPSLPRPPSLALLVPRPAGIDVQIFI